MDEFLEQANSSKMYLLVAAIIALVLFQAFLFYRKGFFDYERGFKK